MPPPCAPAAERWRNYYLKQLRWRVPVCSLLLMVILLMMVWRWNGLVRLGLSDAENLSLLFAITLVLLAFMLKPVFAYRRRSPSMDVADEPLASEGRDSLKQLLFGHLLQAFGPFQSHPRGMVSPNKLANAPLLPAYDAYLAEDRITGQLNGMEVDICEGRFIRYENRRPRVTFQGILILIDISENRTMLRSPLLGRTVLVNDRDKQQVRQLLEGEQWQRFDLPTRPLEDSLEVLTTYPGEAAFFSNAALLEHCNTIIAKLGAARSQLQHADTKGWNGLVTLSEGMARLLDRLVAGSSGPTLHRKARQPQLDAPVDRLQMALWEDKLMVLLPCPHNMFEPDSILNDPLHEEDLQLLYMLMALLDDLTRSIAAFLPGQSSESR